MQSAEQNSESFSKNQLIPFSQSLFLSFQRLYQETQLLRQKNQKIQEEIAELRRRNEENVVILSKKSKDKDEIFEEQKLEQKILLKKETLSSEGKSLQIQKSETVKKKRVRNPSQKRFKCLYPECGRLYDTSVALNLHLKIKHKAGNKKDRERYATHLLFSPQKQKIESEFGQIELPPQYLEDFRKKIEFDKKYNM